MNENVSTYYDVTYSGYKLGWSSQYIHYGFWDEDTKNHEDSLVNTIRYVSKYLNVKEDHVILDAGCGVGSAARYIANNFGARVTGIMNSEVLLENAIKYKEDFPKSELIDFKLMDYHNTSFDDEYFDSVFGLESVCYANKPVFANEMSRIIKSGGKLVIADGYLMRNDLNTEESEIYEKWLKGWALDDLIMPSEFQQTLEASGFSNVKYHDVTDKIKKSSRRMYNQTRFTRIIQYITMKLGLNDPINYYSTRSGYLQKFLVDNRIMGYGILTATRD